MTDHDPNPYATDDSYVEPAKPKRNWLLFSILGCGCLVILGTCVALPTIGAVGVTSLRDLHKEVRSVHAPMYAEFFELMDDGNYEEAYAMCSDDLQAEHSLADLKQTHAKIHHMMGDFIGIEESGGFRKHTVNGRTTIQFDFRARFRRGDGRVNCVLYEHADDEWLIQAYHVNSMGGLRLPECPHCGEEYESPDAKFCPDCGKDLNETPTPEDESDTVGETAEQDD